MSGKKGMKATGRPKVADPRVNITIRISQETRTRIQALRRYGFNAGRWMDDQIERMYEQLKAL